MTRGGVSDVRSVPLDAEIEVFDREFASAPDLTRLSYAARRVLAAAAALFYRHGAAATSVRDITRACGTTPGALYKHFPAKDDLLHCIVIHGHDVLDRRIEGVRAEAEPTPVGQFAAFVRAYVYGHLEHPELAQVVRREYLHLSPRRRAEVVRRRRAMRDQLRGLVQDGVDRGELSLIGTGDATSLAVMVLDMCSRTSEWYDRSRAEAPDVLAGRYVTAALRLAGAAP